MGPHIGQVAIGPQDPGGFDGCLAGGGGAAPGAGGQAGWSWASVPGPVQLKIEPLPSPEETRTGGQAAGACKLQGSDVAGGSHQDLSKPNPFPSALW